MPGTPVIGEETSFCLFVIQYWAISPDLLYPQRLSSSYISLYHCLVVISVGVKV